MRDYGERYDWLEAVFRSFAFGLTAAFLYELDKDDASPQTILLFNDGLSGFDDNAPSYDESGNAYLDIDYTNHGNPKTHPHVPHEHSITIDKDNNPHRGKESDIK